MKSYGFTLIEIVVAMLIISITAAGSAGLIVTANRMLINKRHRTQAYYEASKVLEKLGYYVRSDDEHTFDEGTYSPEIIGLGSEPVIPNVNDPQWTYEVGDISGSNCKTVTVTVTWEEL